MLVRISVDGADGAEGADADRGDLGSLFRWLQRDSAHGARLSLAPHVEPGTQSGTFEAINALITDATGVGGLAVACATWRLARRSRSRIRFERDGVTVVVEDASAEDVLRIVEALSGSRALSTQADPTDPAVSPGPVDPGGPPSSRAATTPEPQPRS